MGPQLKATPLEVTVRKAALVRIAYEGSPKRGFDA